ncbi:unnamed protein product [Prorocentrum cordatum]|uniref:Uncharacterized protein n=1 Tax=Prorocentrum cordatum TaxID=2364126 RepID=A0ABN9V0B9_9DINO|nr:unnamed protein product [Polarella glacialis]
MVLSAQQGAQAQPALARAAPQTAPAVDQHAPQQAVLGKSVATMANPDESAHCKLIFGDGSQRISTFYRYLGAAWKFDCLKVQSLQGYDNKRFSPILLSSLDDDAVDELVYIASNLGPETRIKDFTAKSKGEMREAIAAEISRVLTAYPTRLNDLSADLTNTDILAKRLGYPVECMPVSRRGAAVVDVGAQQRAARIPSIAAPSMSDFLTAGKSKATPKAADPSAKFTSQEEFEQGLSGDEDDQKPAAQDTSASASVGPAASLASGSSGAGAEAAPSVFAPFQGKGLKLTADGKLEMSPGLLEAFVQMSHAKPPAPAVSEPSAPAGMPEGPPEKKAKADETKSE